MFPTQIKNSERICSYCIVEVGRSKVKLCGRCRMVRYCSRECQKKAWLTHKRVCNSEEREYLAKDPALENLSDALSKWIHHWRDTLHQWSVWALDMPNHPRNRLSTHCFAIQLEKRLNPPTRPAQFFRMIGGDVLTRDKISEQLEMTKANIDQWKNDHRGDDTVQIVVVCEGLVRFLWFSLKDTESRRKTSTPDISRALAEDWEDKLTAIIESGDTSKSRQHLLDTVLRFMPPFPDRN